MDHIKSTQPVLHTQISTRVPEAGKKRENLLKHPQRSGGNIGRILDGCLATFFLRDLNGILYSYLIDHLRQNVAKQPSRPSTHILAYV